MQDEEVHPGELSSLITPPGVKSQKNQDVADERDEEYAGQYRNFPPGEILVPRVVRRPLRRRRRRGVEIMRHIFEALLRHAILLTHRFVIQTILARRRRKKRQEGEAGKKKREHRVNPRLLRAWRRETRAPVEYSYGFPVLTVA